MYLCWFKSDIRERAEGDDWTCPHQKDDAIKSREGGNTGWSGEWPMTAGLVLFQTRNEVNDLTPGRSSVSGI